jgi:hypothetical protein
MALPVFAQTDPTNALFSTTATTPTPTVTSLGTPTTTVTSTGTATAATTPAAGTTTATSTTSTTAPDRRVRLAHLSGYSNPYPGILAPLSATQGMMFPYQPTISQNHEVDYQTMAMVHSNQDYHAYAKTPNVTLTITGKFSVQNVAEGAYALAAIHFLRASSKMNFGQNDANKGLPPPILLLNGYGTYMFHDVKVILRGSNLTFDENIDMVKVSLSGGTAWLPAVFTISTNLTVQQTPNALKNTFTLDGYRDGSLLATGGWL